MFFIGLVILISFMNFLGFINIDISKYLGLVSNEFYKKAISNSCYDFDGFSRSLSGYFVNWDSLRNFTDKDATNFYMIIAGFAAFLGCFKFIQLHLQKLLIKGKLAI